MPGANQILLSKHSLANLAVMMMAVLLTLEQKGVSPRRLAVISDSVNWSFLMLRRLWPQSIEKASR